MVLFFSNEEYGSDFSDLLRSLKIVHVKKTEGVNCRLQVAGAGCRLQVAGCRLQVAGCRLQFAGAGCRLQVAGAGCRLQVAGAGCRLRLYFFSNRRCMIFIWYVST